MSDAKSELRRRWLIASAWVLIACGCAHLLGHVKSVKDLSASIPVDADDATRKLHAAAEAMSATPIGGGVLDSSLLGVLQGMSLFFTLGLIGFGVTVVRVLQSSSDPAVSLALARVVVGFCVVAVVVSTLYFPVAPTMLLVGATVCGTSALFSR